MASNENESPEYDLSEVTIKVTDKKDQEILSYVVTIDGTAKSVATSDLSEGLLAAGVLHWAGECAEQLEQFLIEVLDRRVKEIS